MPNYYYSCDVCASEATVVKGAALTHEEEMAASVFETSHTMNPTKKELHEALECPRCNGHEATRFYGGDINIIGYVRGRCYSDKRGLGRDRDTFKLSTSDPDTGESNDPYHEHRQSGEVDDLKNQLKKAGQFNPRTSYLVVGDSSDKKPITENTSDP